MPRSKNVQLATLGYYARKGSSGKFGGAARVFQVDGLRTFVFLGVAWGLANLATCRRDFCRAGVQP